MTLTAEAPRLLDTTAVAPTLADVAQLAGVSIATASRVLNNSARVSPQARQQVRTAASRLGYVRHRAAPVHPKRKVRTVAAVLYANYERILGDPFFSRVILGATEELARHDVPLMILQVNDERLPLVERYIHSGQFDGLVVLADHGNHPLADSLPSLGIPWTLVGAPNHPCTSYVDCDNRAGAREAVEYLIRTGRRSIATIAGPPIKPVGADRLAGYREALANHQLPELPVAYGDWSQASGVHAMCRLLDLRPNLDAVFVASDVMATGALYALRRAGRRVPEDVAVIGFDETEYGSLSTPALTTVHIDAEILGRIAARAVLDIDTEGLAPVPGRIVVRESV